MPIHKIIAGDPSTYVTGIVANVEEDTSGNYGPEWKITMADGLVHFIKPQQGQRQLERLGFGYATDMIGEDLTFSRVPMRNDPSKSFLNIDKAGATAARSAATLRAPAPRPVASRPASNGKQAFSAGPRIPGLDPDNELDLEHADAQERAELAQATQRFTPPQVQTMRQTIAATAPKSDDERHAEAQQWYAKHFAFALDELLPMVARASEAAGVPIEVRWDLNGTAAAITIQGSKR